MKNPQTIPEEALFHVFPRGLLAGERAEECGQVRSQFLVFENVIGDAARVHGGALQQTVARTRSTASLTLAALCRSDLNARPA